MRLPSGLRSINKLSYVSEEQCCLYPAVVGSLPASRESHYFLPWNSRQCWPQGHSPARSYLDVGIAPMPKTRSWLGNFRINVQRDLECASQVRGVSAINNLGLYYLQYRAA